MSVGELFLSFFFSRIFKKKFGFFPGDLGLLVVCWQRVVVDWWTATRDIFLTGLPLANSLIYTVVATGASLNHGLLIFYQKLSPLRHEKKYKNLFLMPFVQTQVRFGIY